MNILIWFLRLNSCSDDARWELLPTFTLSIINPFQNWHHLTIFVWMRLGWSNLARNFVSSSSLSCTVSALSIHTIFQQPQSIWRLQLNYKHGSTNLISPKMISPVSPSSASRPSPIGLATPWQTAPYHLCKRNRQSHWIFENLDRRTKLW